MILLKSFLSLDLGITGLAEMVNFKSFFTAAIQVPLNIPRKKKGIRRIPTGNSPIGPLDLNGMRQLPKIKRNPPA